MLDRQTRPLEIASRVLEPETIQMVRADRKNIDRTGYLILDRWALNQPDELKELEHRDPDLVLDRLYEQQELEGAALASATAAEMQTRGYSQWEILELMGIDTRVRTTASVWAPLEPVLLG